MSQNDILMSQNDVCIGNGGPDHGNIYASIKHSTFIPSFSGTKKLGYQKVPKTCLEQPGTRLF